MAADSMLNPLTANANAYTQNFRMPSGDDRDLIVPVQEPTFDANGEPILDSEGNPVMADVDLTGAALTWEMKRQSRESSPDLEPLLTKTLVNGGLELDSQDPSVVIIHMRSEDTEGHAGIFVHELQVVDTFGHVNTAMRGKATIFKDTVI